MTKSSCKLNERDSEEEVFDDDMISEDDLDDEFAEN